jgi:sugar phosphate isomerase/epimerase
MQIERELILSHFCLQSADFTTRVEAARAAGYSGIGLWITEYERIRESGLSDAEMRSILAGKDIGMPEIEVLTGWGGNDDERRESRRQLDLACHMADVFGSKYLQLIGPYKGELESAAERLRQVCVKAKQHGLEISLEFLPVTNISNLSDAVELISMAGNDNLGICLDSWHFFRGNNDLSELRSLGAEDINLLQLNDGSLRAEDDNYIRDCLTNRRLFSQGEFPLRPFLQEIDAIGYCGPISIEIMSTDLEARAAKDAASAMLDSFHSLNF